MDDVPVTHLEGGASRPVSKIVCVGRNYRAHAAEMGAPVPREPMLFLKPSTALATDGAELPLPTFSEEVHHEVELVLRVGRRLTDATPSSCRGAVDGVGIGIDLTARDVQARAKERGHPWSVAKGFDGAAPVSRLLPLTHLDELGERTLSLFVNGARRQHGHLADMLFPCDVLLAFISSRFTLLPGDLVFTGTPEGVGPVISGDAVRAELDPGMALSVTFVRHQNPPE